MTTGNNENLLSHCFVTRMTTGQLFSAHGKEGALEAFVTHRMTHLRRELSSPRPPQRRETVQVNRYTLSIKALKIKLIKKPCQVKRIENIYPGNPGRQVSGSEITFLCDSYCRLPLYRCEAISDRIVILSMP